MGIFTCFIKIYIIIASYNNFGLLFCLNVLAVVRASYTRLLYIFRLVVHGFWKWLCY